MQKTIRNLLIATIVALIVGGFAGYRIANLNRENAQAAESRSEEEARGNTICEMVLSKSPNREKPLALFGGSEKDNCINKYVNINSLPPDTEIMWLW